MLLKTLAVEGAELVTSIMLNYLLNAILPNQGALLHSIIGMPFLIFAEEGEMSRYLKEHLPTKLQ